MFYSEHITKPITKIEIYRRETDKSIITIGDAMSPDPKKFKLEFEVVKLAPGASGKLRVEDSVKHWVDVDKFMTLCRLVIQGRVFDFVKGNGIVFEDMKGTVKENYTEGRVFRIQFLEGKNYPFMIEASNGPGEAMERGAVKMVRAEHTAKTFLTPFEFESMAGKVMDYVHAWEAVNFRRCQEAWKTIIKPMADAPAGFDPPTPLSEYAGRDEEEGWDTDRDIHTVVSGLREAILEETPFRREVIDALNKMNAVDRKSWVAWIAKRCSVVPERLTEDQALDIANTLRARRQAA